tara:strand:+ start:311446 stop:311706 length:261 start_codon:yes stop_codon:yes gene_type:complete
MAAQNIQHQHTTNQHTESANQKHFNQNQLFRPKEAAEFLHVSERTLRNYMSSGEIHYSKYRRAVFIKLSDIEAFIDRHSKNGGENK